MMMLLSCWADSKKYAAVTLLLFLLYDFKKFFVIRLSEAWKEVEFRVEEIKFRQNYCKEWERELSRNKVKDFWSDVKNHIFVTEASGSYVIYFSGDVAGDWRRHGLVHTGMEIVRVLIPDKQRSEV